MKLSKLVALVLVFCLCVVPAYALAATEEDARALMTECEIGEPVAEKDNLMGISLKNVTYDKDGDVYVQWAFSNENMQNNLLLAFTKMRYFDPADLTAPFAPFTIKDGKTVSMTFKEGDAINIVDFAHLDHEQFNPESGVIFFYFNGSGEGAPEQLYTCPLVFTIFIDEEGPHAVETEPRYAPETMITAFNQQ